MTYDLLLDALGDSTRRIILEHLGGGASPVGALARRLPVSRPAVSQHLRVLRQAGLVSARQEGTRRLYAINTAGAAQLRAYADHLWDVALERFKEVVERGAADRDSHGREAPGGDSSEGNSRAGHAIRTTTRPRRRGPGFGRRKR